MRRLIVFGLVIATLAVGVWFPGPGGIPCHVSGGAVICGAVPA